MRCRKAARVPHGRKAAIRSWLATLAPPAVKDSFYTILEQSLLQQSITRCLYIPSPDVKGKIKT